MVQKKTPLDLSLPSLLTSGPKKSGLLVHQTFNINVLFIKYKLILSEH